MVNFQFQIIGGYLNEKRAEEGGGGGPTGNLNINERWGAQIKEGV